VTQINRVQIGDRLHSFPEFHALPPGTTIGTRAGDRAPFTKGENGLWVSVNTYDRNGISPENNFSLGYMRVLTYPDNYTPEPAVPPTLTQFKWQFRDYMFAAQEMHGVSFDAVNRAMRELEVTDDLFPLGVEMFIESSTERERLPEGTIIVSGNPQDVSRSGAFIREPSRWRALGLGLLREPRRGYSAYVEAMPGSSAPPDWWTEIGSSADEDAVLAFKQRAYQVSMKVKSNQQWCSTLESCISRVGLTPEIMHIRNVGDVRVGDQVNPETARTLPVGTVLRWQSQDHQATRVQWFVRDDSAQNLARTRRVCGYREDGLALVHYARRMEVMAFPPPEGGWMHLSVDLVRALPSIAPGTVLAYRVEEPQYMVARDHRISGIYDVIGGANGQPPATGQHRLADFDSSEQLFVARFALPEATA